MICLCALFSGYTGIQLAANWTMMQKRWPKYRSVCRKPYSEMAYCAVGPKMRCRAFIAMMICLTQVGFITVLELLAAKNTSVLLNFFFGIKLSEFLLDDYLCWSYRLADYNVKKSNALLAGGCILCLIQHYRNNLDSPERQFNLQNFFMAYGTIVFAYGGHGVFPTIQHDMKKPRLFARSVWVAYILILFYYLSVGIGGYLVYGGSVGDAVIHSIQLQWVQQTVIIPISTIILFYYLSVGIGGYLVYGGSVGDAVIHSIQLQWVQQTVNVMISLHVITTIVIAFSPMTQQVEALLRISHSFGWQRFLVRTFLFWTLIFVALTVPNFGPLMDMFGASTMSMMTMIMPSVFYLYLNASKAKRDLMIKNGEISKESPDETRATLSDKTEPFLAFGIMGGVVAFVFSFKKLIGADVDPPCYVQYFRQGKVI
ncbi:unnamed protein product [Strongylus vulgaris]|uniref:Amino acid transporter transmembrane domain-containing protein n=1 Tax=Strongylus vulgaris TaxID=40348 RepID=A0A3P7LBK2_STRVU|nr:unnamed protein product [Strongylus vulgaris]